MIPARAFEAQYSGLCTECGYQIQVGEMIVRYQDGEYAHDSCNAQSERPPREVCTECWLEKPCGCES